MKLMQMNVGANVMMDGFFVTWKDIPRIICFLPLQCQFGKFSYCLNT